MLHDFSPAVEMASIDEAYLDMTGTERLHGPPLLSAHKLHQQMKERTGLELLHRHRQLKADGQNQL